MAIRAPRRRSDRVALTAIAALLLGGCGSGGSQTAGGGCEGSSGPDTSGVRSQLNEQIASETGGAASIARFVETGRRAEGNAQLRSCQIAFDGEIEFSGDAYYGTSERKAGDRVPFSAEAEYLSTDEGWERATLGIHPR